MFVVCRGTKPAFDTLSNSTDNNTLDNLIIIIVIILITTILVLNIGRGITTKTPKISNKLEISHLPGMSNYGWGVGSIRGWGRLLCGCSVH